MGLSAPWVVLGRGQQADHVARPPTTPCYPSPAGKPASHLEKLDTGPSAWTKRAGSQDSVAMVLEPHESTRQPPRHPTGIHPVGWGVGCSHHHARSRKKAAVSHSPGEESRRRGLCHPQDVLLYSGLCPLLVQYGRQALSSLDVPILWCLRGKIAQAVTLTVHCKRFTSFDTCGLVSIIPHNTGEVPIKASSMFNGSRSQGDRGRQPQPGSGCPRRQRWTHAVLSHSGVTSCFSAV